MKLINIPKGSIIFNWRYIYNEVTLELLQVTPSHGAPQGSSDLSQPGGVFSHIALRDLSAVTATLYNHYKKCIKLKVLLF
jgi:hypothetical protein